MDLNEEENFTLANDEDRMILMHRDAHFAGDFESMLDYYKNEGKGICQEISISRIRELADYEASAGKNIASLMLTGADAEKISRVRDAYKGLRELYENSSKISGPRLIADLILSEEESPEDEIAAITNEKSKIVPLLIDLLRSEDFYDPLFPGYGLAPTLAAKCLGIIGDKRAMRTLFEGIGEGDIYSEDCLLDALKLIGEPAKAFLLQVLQSEPLNFDNERAAIALVRFKEDPIVASTCLKMLLKPKVWQDPALAVHLILTCEELRDPEERNQFCSLEKEPMFPKILLQDLKVIAKQFH